MNCETCGKATTEIAAKTIRRTSDGATKCHRLECGHAWHVTTPTATDPGARDAVAPTPCGCREIVVVNELVVAGRRLALAGENLGDDAFREWSKQVLNALDGIPAESGAPSLVRSATTAAKSPTSSMLKKVNDLNKLLVRAISAVS